MLLFDVVVVVPRLAGAAPDLHEAHAALQQPPRDQQLPAVQCRRRTASRIVLRLAVDVERVGRLGLHAVGQLERLDAGFELRVVAAARPRCRSLSCCTRSSCRRCSAGESTVLRMFSISFSTSVCLRVDVRPLVRAGQERRPPVLRGDDRIAAGAHGDEAGQVLVLASPGRR